MMMTTWPLGLVPSPSGVDALGISFSGLLSCTETSLFTSAQGSSLVHWKLERT